MRNNLEIGGAILMVGQNELKFPDAGTTYHYPKKSNPVLDGKDLDPDESIV